jgi:hypothetical protein
MYKLSVGNAKYQLMQEKMGQQQTRLTSLTASQSVSNLAKSLEDSLVQATKEEENELLSPGKKPGHRGE